MTGNEYQALAMRTRNGALSREDSMNNAVMGLCGEAGECVDIVKKARYQGHALDEKKLIDELSDVMWYIALACEVLGIGINDVMAHNVDKLKKRYPEGFEVDKSIHRVI